MSKAKDYRICCGLFSAYIAKTSKRNSNTMTSDRRAITDEEVLTLINWKLQDFVSRNKGAKGFAFTDYDGKKVEVHYLDEEPKGGKE